MIIKSFDGKHIYYVVSNFHVYTVECFDKNYVDVYLEYDNVICTLGKKIPLDKLNWYYTEILKMN